VGLRLFGVAWSEGGGGPPTAPDTTIVPFRDIAAIVRAAAYEAIDVSAEAVGEHHSVLEHIFRRGTVLPAPFGTIFNSTDQVHRWLEMNYIALSEGLHYLEGRCESRLFVRQREATRDTADLASTSAECFRSLRRHAVSWVPIRGEPAEVACAFLLARDQMDDFTLHVREEATHHRSLRFEQSGPWPPYDFVRFDFGA
jgi:hypothetical protein